MLYIVRGFNVVSGTWEYYNSFDSYLEACELRDYLQRRYRNITFEIFSTEED